MRKILFLMICTVFCASCDDYPPLEDYGEEEKYYEQNDSSEEDEEDCWVIWPVVDE